MLRLRRALTAVAVCGVAAGITAVAPTARATGGQFGYGTPEFINSAAPSTVDSTLGVQTVAPNVDFAGEPSIGIDWTTGAGLYQASNSTYKLAFDNTKTPPAVSWSDVSSPFSQFNLDPILGTNSATGTTLAGGDDGACGVMSLTHDDGTTWIPTLPCPLAPDHPTVGIGPFVSPAPVDAVGGEAAYFCQQPILNAAPDECSYSHNGGLTWQPSVPDSNATCQSLFGHVKIGPDGTAYIPDNTCTDASGNSVEGGLITTDSGQTLGGYTIPGATSPADGFDPSVAVDKNNRVYQSWSRAGDYHPVVTWSDDHAKTWAPPVDLAATVSPALTAGTFESAVAGDSGRAAVAFLGTWAGGAGVDPFATGFHGIWYLFVSYTYDGGKTWQTVQATPDPVQRGEIDAGGTTTSGQRNLLDFMDASVTKDGRVVVGYADGCINTCDGPNGTEAESTDAYATVAYQSAGEGLFAAGDTAAPVTAPAAPTLTASTPHDGSVVLNWNVPSDGNSPITGYQVYRGTSAGTEKPYATVSSTQTYTDNAVTLGTSYVYRVAAINGVGTGAASNEVSATPTSVPGAATLTATAGKGQVSLSWTAPSTGGSPITSYSIYRGTAPGGETLVQTITSGTSYVDNTVTGGTTYYYRVAATNADGTGPQSNEASATPKGKH